MRRVVMNQKGRENTHRGFIWSMHRKGEEQGSVRRMKTMEKARCTETKNGEDDYNE